jgi:hypothetical protein
LNPITPTTESTPPHTITAAHTTPAATLPSVTSAQHINAVTIAAQPLSEEVVRSFEDHVARVEQQNPPENSKRHRFRAYSYAGRSDAELDRWAEELSDVEVDENDNDGEVTVTSAAALAPANSPPSCRQSPHNPTSTSPQASPCIVSDGSDESEVEVPSREQLRQMRALPIQLGAFGRCVVDVYAVAVGGWLGGGSASWCVVGALRFFLLSLPSVACTLLPSSSPLADELHCLMWNWVK